MTKKIQKLKTHAADQPAGGKKPQFNKRRPVIVAIPAAGNNSKPAVPATRPFIALLCRGEIITSQADAFFMGKIPAGEGNHVKAVFGSGYNYPAVPATFVVAPGLPKADGKRNKINAETSKR